AGGGFLGVVIDGADLGFGGPIGADVIAVNRGVADGLVHVPALWVIHRDAAVSAGVRLLAVALLLGELGLLLLHRDGVLAIDLRLLGGGLGLALALGFFLLARLLFGLACGGELFPGLDLRIVGIGASGGEGRGADQ